MNIKIEKNIPILGKGGNSTLTAFMEALKKMEIGDSFLVTRRDRGRVAGIARRLKIKIVTRASENGQIRIWKQ